MPTLFVCSLAKSGTGSQNRNAGKDSGALTSVISLMSRQRAASAAEQQVSRQTIAGSWMKDYLRHLGRIAILLAPERFKRLDHTANRCFIIGEPFRHILLRTSGPVCPHPTRF